MLGVRVAFRKVPVVVFFDLLHSRGVVDGQSVEFLVNGWRREWIAGLGLFELFNLKVFLLDVSDGVSSFGVAMVLGDGAHAEDMFF